MPYLVTVTGNRIPLRRGHGYVLGRGLDCDIALEDSACSRRHALLTVTRGSDAVFLEDLGSRNGTFLNGETVRSRVALRDGNRIQVGASIFLLRVLRDLEVDMADTGTVAFEPEAVTQDGDGGELGPLGLAGILERLSNAGCNVTLHVALPGEHARVQIRGGEVHHADFAGLEGFNALVKLARQPTGLYWLVNDEDECERTIQDPTDRLLADLARCLDPAAAQ